MTMTCKVKKLENSGRPLAIFRALFGRSAAFFGHFPPDAVTSEWSSRISTSNSIIEIDTTKSWDNNKNKIKKPGPIYKLSTDYDRKVSTANKIKNKYFKKKVGQRKHVNKKYLLNG